MISGKTFAPESLPRFGDKTTRDAVVCDEEKIFTDRNRTRDIGGSHRITPGDVGFGHVAASVRPDRENVLCRKSAGEKKKVQLLVVNK